MSYRINYVIVMCKMLHLETKDSIYLCESILFYNEQKIVCFPMIECFR